jgi:hypothetical protein
MLPRTPFQPLLATTAELGSPLRRTTTRPTHADFQRFLFRSFFTYNVLGHPRSILVLQPAGLVCRLELPPMPNIYFIICILPPNTSNEGSQPPTSTLHSNLLCFVSGHLV